MRPASEYIPVPGALLLALAYVDSTTEDLLPEEEVDHRVEFRRSFLPISFPFLAPAALLVSQNWFLVATSICRSIEQERGRLPPGTI